MTTVGKYRHLLQSSTPDGHFVVVAIDHRANLKDKLDAVAPISDEGFADFKQLVLRHLLPYASATLIDPAYGIARGIASRIITGSHGILAPLEVTEYDVHPSQRQVNWITGWGVEKIKLAGCTGVKLLLNYHPDAPNAAEKQAVVASIVEDCHRYDIPFFLEPIVHALGTEQKLSGDEFRYAVVTSAKHFSQLNVDILKMEFPVDVKQQPDESIWAEAAQELDAACTVPWALLSAGVSYEIFLKQAALACQAGASGVIVGRAVWAEAVTLQGSEREDFLATVAAQRMQELGDVCAAYATAWWERTATPETTLNWYA